ncbi:MAG: orotidine 5'-phosphate decarboxylase / HUMPS family protein, partial [Candidatus Nanopelagicus sp.]
LITPGVRDVGDDHGDQVRVMTAQDAIKAGSDFVVIGRSITNLWDGSDKAMRTKIEQIRSSIN